MRTTLALIALGVIGVFAFLWARQRKCNTVMRTSDGGILCAGIAPPVRPNTAETDPRFAQPSQAKRLCNTMVGAGSAIAANSSNPQVKAAAGYAAYNGTETCDLVSEFGGAVQDIYKGITSLF